MDRSLWERRVARHIRRFRETALNKGESMTTIVSVLLDANENDPPPIFSWDTLLDKGVAGAESAIASAVLSEILGPDAWEREVTDDLTAVIGKLDQILTEIRALRQFITDALRSSWREILRVNVQARIEDIKD